MSHLIARLLAPIVGVLWKAASTVIGDAREARHTAARVLARFPRMLVRRGVEIRLQLVEHPLDRHQRVIEVSGVPIGDPGVVTFPLFITADQRVAVWLQDPVHPEKVDAAIEQVAVAARQDTALAAALAKLPDATPLAGGELAPGVELAPDGLQVGLLDGRLVAILDGVHHFWPTVERDPARIAKVIDRLRDHVRDHAAPYR